MEHRLQIFETLLTSWWQWLGKPGRCVCWRNCVLEAGYGSLKDGSTSSSLLASCSSCPACVLPCLTNRMDSYPRSYKPKSSKLLWPWDYTLRKLEIQPWVRTANAKAVTCLFSHVELRSIHGTPLLSVIQSPHYTWVCLTPLRPSLLSLEFKPKLNIVNKISNSASLYMGIMCIRKITLQVFITTRHTSPKPQFPIYFNGLANIYTHMYMHMCIIYTFIEIKTHRKHSKTLKLWI